MNPEDVSEQLHALTYTRKGPDIPSRSVSEAPCKPQIHPILPFLIQLPTKWALYGHRYLPMRSSGESTQGCNRAVAVTANLPQI